MWVKIFFIRSFILLKVFNIIIISDIAKVAFLPINQDSKGKNAKP